MSANGPRTTPPGPPAPPACGICGPGFTIRGYTAGCPRHDPAARAALEEDIYEAALVELAHLDDDEAFNLRLLMPHPERVPAEVDPGRSCRRSPRPRKDVPVNLPLWTIGAAWCAACFLPDALDWIRRASADRRKRRLARVSGLR